MQRLILPIFFVGSSIGLFFTYIDDTYQSLTPLREEHGRLDEALTRSAELRSIRENLIQRRGTILPADEERLERLLPDTIDTVRLILDIDAVAKIHSLDLQNVTVEASAMPDASEEPVEGEAIPSAGAHQTAVMSFAVTATYDEFLRFIRDLERKLRLADITNMRLLGNDGDDEYQFEVTLETYWMP